jgi:hypothetical protein
MDGSMDAERYSAQLEGESNLAPSATVSSVSCQPFHPRYRSCSSGLQQRLRTLTVARGRSLGMRLSRWRSSRVSGPASIGTEDEMVFLLNSHRNPAPPPHSTVRIFPLYSRLRTVSVPRPRRVHQCRRVCAISSVRTAHRPAAGAARRGVARAPHDTRTQARRGTRLTAHEHTDTRTRLTHDTPTRARDYSRAHTLAHDLPLPCTTCAHSTLL